MPDVAPKMTTTDWRSQCAQADASDLLDTAQSGIQAIANALPYDRAYEFSNGRKFRDGKGPYGT